MIFFELFLCFHTFVYFRNINFKGENKALVTRVSPLEDEKLFIEKSFIKKWRLRSDMREFALAHSGHGSAPENPKFSMNIRGGEAVENNICK